MKRHPFPHHQRGATLIVGLILLVLITLMVTAAFNLSSSNLKSVGNMQFRSEALAAANKAVEQVVASAFTTPALAQSINVDMNNDGTRDYLVSIAVPTCISATIASDATLSSASLGGSMSSAANWSTIWEIDATVTDPVSGAFVRTRTGIRVLRTQSQKDAECV